MRPAGFAKTGPWSRGAMTRDGGGLEVAPPMAPTVDLGTGLKFLKMDETAANLGT